LVIAKRNDWDANGILVVSDIIRGVIIPDKKLDEVSVYEIMSKPVISIPASLNARYVSRLLINAKISVAPVEENGQYIGIINLRDFLFNSQHK
jgi:signal-transduction protein with cAMP-binding, CBS, and nucleotidyltransferase domain